MIQVYHYSFDGNEQNRRLVDILWRLSAGDIDTVQSVWEGFYSDIAYLPVALVDTDSLDAAFDLTNHLDESWTTNKGVSPLLTKVRSTSVGDVMVQDGRMFVVSMMGFTEIPAESA